MLYRGTFEGGCFCGAVRYAFDDVFDAGYCHCGICRRSSGAPVMAWANTPRAGFRIKSGTPRFMRSSAEFRRAFCADCGTLMWTESIDPARWSYVSVHHGTIDGCERRATACLGCTSPTRCRAPARTRYRIRASAAIRAGATTPSGGVYIGRVSAHREGAAMAETTVFQSGNSQAVRLPKEFRFKSKTVEIFRRGDEVVLRERKRSLGELLDEAILRLPPLTDEDIAQFDQAMAIARAPQPQQQRDWS